ncbi:hypothetical protein [Psychromonas sp. Urea-02u-13]|uniref:hypothetical protein n=1 Tax=Psychromonas sp. Urea-02u-13 TaxID=2058326 RepID=UPI000C34F69F|nr:hypothetical protein [Psychromonas sp. Urea-02u-13]PKG37453.1 hypothetical protein CXF74_18815 [Psychromonas sp. Urea-02u-13]
MHNENILRDAFKEKTRKTLSIFELIFVAIVVLGLYILIVALKAEQTVPAPSGRWEVYELSKPTELIAGVTTEYPVTYGAFSPTISSADYGDIYMNDDGYIIVDSSNIKRGCKYMTINQSTGEINGVKVKMNGFCTASARTYTISPQTQKGKDFLKSQLIKKDEVVIKLTKNSSSLTFTAMGFNIAVKETKQKTQRSTRAFEARQQAAI